MVITICKKEFSVILIITVLQIIYGGKYLYGSRKNKIHFKRTI